MEKRALMELPKCPVHGTTMIYQEPRTYEQRWVGATYNCGEAGCFCSTVFPSAELREIYYKHGLISLEAMKQADGRK